MLEEFCYPIYDELVLIILGAKAFVAYSVELCSRILGQQRIPIVVSFVPHVELRQLDTKVDSCRVKEVLQLGVLYFLNDVSKAG